MDKGYGIRDGRLIQSVQPYPRIVIYGAGEIADLLYSTLEKHVVAPVYCVVTANKNGKGTWHGLPVYTLQERASDLRREDTVVVVAVSSIYEKEIKQALASCQISNYIFASSFLGKVVSFEHYKGRTCGEYLDEIAGWYVEIHSPNGADLYKEQERIQKLALHRETDPHEIVFVVGKLSPRVAKIAKALHNQNYKIRILFTPNANVNEQDLFFVNIINCCDSYCLCSFIEQLMYELIISKAIVVHIFSQIGTVEAAAILIHGKKLFPAIIFEQYDIANGMYTQIPKMLLEVERYCIGHADGVCCRGFEYEYLLEAAGIARQGKLFKFFDYCDSTNLGSQAVGQPSPSSSDEEELSLCCAGGISTETEQPGVSIACWLDFAKMCKDNHCHLHLYPANWDSGRYAGYLQLEQQNQYFHLHQPVKYQELIQELSKYDYGITPIRKEFRTKKIDACYTLNKHIYAESNRYYDYLDAGLAIVATHPMRQAEYLERKGVLINFAMEEYDFAQLRKKKTQLKNNVAKVKRELDIKNHIGELIGFYHSFA